MVGDGIKAARIQARHSPLIGLTWAPVSFPGNIKIAVKNAGIRLGALLGGRPAGRHAAPGRSFLGRHATR